MAIIEDTAKERGGQEKLLSLRLAWSYYELAQILNSLELEQQKLDTTPTFFQSFLKPSSFADINLWDICLNIQKPYHYKAEKVSQPSEQQRQACQEQSPLGVTPDWT